MTHKTKRGLVGVTGGLWGLCVGLIAVGLLTTLSSDWAGLWIGFVFVLALPFGVIGGTVLGVRGARRLLPFIQPLHHTNPHLRRAAYVAAGVPIALIVCFFMPFNPLIPPSDAALIADFNRNEVSLNELASMMHADKKLEAVAMEWTHPAELQAIKVSPLRIANYRKLLHRSSVKSVYKVGGEGGSIRFLKWVIGGGAGGEEIRGFIYIPHSSGAKHASPGEKRPNTRRYRHIKGDWYLFYDFYQ